MTMSSIKGPPLALYSQRHHPNTLATFPFRRHFVIVIVSIGILSAMILYREQLTTSHLMSDTDSEQKIIKPKQDKHKNEKENTAIITHDAQYYLKELNSSKDKIKEQIKSDYGKYYETLFNSKIVERVMELSDISHERIVRRLQIKFLSNLFGPTENKFVWVTAGHSVAGGHGNLMNQSYTAMLEDTALEGFASVGISMEARNYAISNTPSGPELAMCMESVYGPDVDVLSWDFGLTDGRDYDRIKWWGNRAGMSQSRPILFAIVASLSSARLGKFQNFNDAGMAIVGLNGEKILEVQKENLPDAKEENDQEGLPAAVRYFLCGGHAENGDPCKKHKFNADQYCDGRDVKYRTSWHPGWKHHMLIGRLLGTYLLHLLTKAIEAFVPTNVSTNTTHTILPTISQSYLDHLLVLEKNDSVLFHNSTTAFEFKTTFSKDDELGENLHQQLLRKKSICHTSLLPSYSRYQNIIFDMKPPSPNGTYERGYSKKDIEEIKNDLFPLVYDPNERQKPCGDVLLEFDFKDYFLVRHGFDSKLTLPNDREVEVYGESESNEAAVMVCVKRCDWGKCPEGFLTLKDINPSPPEINEEKNESITNTTNTIKPPPPLVEVSINEEQVVNARQIDNSCSFLENSENGIFWDYHPDRRLNIKFNVLEKEKFLEITSIVIFL